MITANITKTTNIVIVGDEVIHDERLWTVVANCLLEEAPQAVYDLKLHRVPGRQDDALSEEWVDVTASDDELWLVQVSPSTTQVMLVLLFANLDPATGIYGDIYTDRQDCLLEHPGQSVITGYGVLDVGTALIVDGSEDFYATLDEAQAFLDASGH